jgi:type IV secretion system protein VirB3
MQPLARVPVFRALTEPQMFGGVTYSFFILNAVLTTELFLISGSFWAVPLALVIHAVGYLASLKEPRIFDLWFTAVRMCGRSRTYGTWGCNSYQP